MSGDDPAGNGQAEPGPAVFRREERLEDPIAHVRPNAAARIGNLDLVVAGDHRAFDAAGEVKEDAHTANCALTGGVVGGAAGLAASLMALSIPGIGPIVAAGPLVAMLSGAGAGAMAGGLIGALTDAGVPEENANYYAETVRRGGALVTVKVDESRADRAAEIMRVNGAIDLDERVSR